MRRGGVVFFAPIGFWAFLMPFLLLWYVFRATRYLWRYKTFQYILGGVIGAWLGWFVIAPHL
jgi:hypothetical protein